MPNQEILNNDLILLEHWYCYYCGGVINALNKGSLEWYKDKKIVPNLVRKKDIE